MVLSAKVIMKLKLTHVVLLNGDHHATDINECTMSNGGCEDECVNTIGSFFCTCPSFGEGFAANGTVCTGRLC